jgi:hypothetical protein
LLRNRYLREKYAATWLGVAVLVLVVAIWPQILDWAADLLGVQVPINLALFVGALFLLLLSVQQSVELSSLEAKTRILAEEVALLRTELEVIQSADADVADLATDSGDDTAGGDGKEEQR